MTVNNKAAWLMEKQQHPFEIKDAPMPTPKPDQVIVQAHAIAVNPFDWIVQAAGVIIDTFPKIIGEDVAGTITAIGADVENFAVGDRVLGCIDVTESAATQGTFQLYSAVNVGMLARLPDNTSFAQGSVLPIALCTAATSLFQQDAMALPLPQLQPVSNGKTLLIWAASTVVGSCAIQLAIASGYEVVAIAGKANSGYCRSVGATQVFDHASDTVIEDIVFALKGKQVEGGFCAHTDSDALKRCVEVVGKTGGRKVGTVLPPGWAFPEDVPHGVELSYCKCQCLIHTIQVLTTSLQVIVARCNITKLDPLFGASGSLPLSPAV